MSASTVCAGSGWELQVWKTTISRRGSLKRDGDALSEMHVDHNVLVTNCAVGAVSRPGWINKGVHMK